MAELLLTHQRGPIFEIVLNRPEKRNAINPEMMDQLVEAIRLASRTDGVRTVVVRGEGLAFSSGIDLTSFMHLPEKYGNNWLQRMRSVTHDVQSVITLVERLEIPTLALIHGHCVGMGLELCLACDLRIAAQGAKLGLPETLRGMIPDVGGSTRLTRLVGPARAKELIFTGRLIDADVAERLGIVNSVVSESELLAAGDTLAAEIQKAAPLAVGMAKRVIDGLADIDRGLLLEGWAQSQLIPTEDFTEGIQSFLQKRPPEFKGK